jgi:thiamine kinase-like enzyme
MIRKSCSTADYNTRIENQLNKQKVFYRNSLHENILTPQIFCSGKKENGLSFFEMEYVPGEKYSEYFLSCQISKIRETIDQFISFIESELNRSELVKLSPKIFLDKVGSIKQLLEKQNLFSGAVDETYDFLMHNIPDSFIPYGICHGDLTLSNVIFSNQKIYIIDFLDSFIETAMVDIVKLRQDTKFHWSLVIETDIPSYQRNKIKQVLNFFDQYLVTYFSKNEYFLKWYGYLEKLNLLRILPYLENNNERDFVINCLIHT